MNLKLEARLSIIHSQTVVLIVKQVLSVIALLSMLCSIAAANVGALLLCSHEDGFGHVVDFNTHENESHDSCDHSEEHKSSSHNSLCEDAVDCTDSEVPDQELEDFSSNTDRSPLKSPSLQHGEYAFAPIEAAPSIEKHSKPPAFPLSVESQSRRFAKTVQIRR